MRMTTIGNIYEQRYSVCINFTFSWDGKMKIFKILKWRSLHDQHQ